MAEVCNTCLAVVNHTKRGMCAVCHRVDDHTRRPPAQKRYPAEYQRNRQIILQGNPECYCGCGRPADTVDHIIPRAQGGGHGLENLRPAAGVCNSGRRD